MKIIHIGWYNPEPTGGVGKTILEQTRAIHEMGHEIEIWNFTSKTEMPQKMMCSAPFAVWHLPMHQNRIQRFFSLHPESCRWIKSRLDEVKVFHIHSVFIPENNLVAALGKPYIVTPNGGWSDIVLNGKRKWLKRFWILTKESRMWRSAHAIQAVSREEVKQLSKHQGIAPIHYIPNGTHLPVSILNRKKRDCYLYIGRLDIYQKGLDLLFESLRIVKERGKSIPRLIVAGPDYRGGSAFLEEFRELHQLQEYVELRGAVHAQEKEDLFDRALLFIHTSRWEGLPLVLLEALGHGIPCLLTPGTNVATEWSSAGCAFATSNKPAGIADELIRIADLPLLEEREAARNLAESEYSWQGIAQQLAALYAASSIS